LGIEVKNHPGTESDWREKVWNDEYKWSYNYGKDATLGYDENGKSIHPTHEQLHKRATEWADRYTPRKMNNWYDANMLYVEYDDGENHRVICQKVSVKSKEITVEYIDKLIAKDKKAYSGTFGKFTDAMNKVLETLGYTGRFWVYPTTYGIGVWVFYNFNAEKNIKDVESILKANNVQYYNEYSDAHYVYRFKVSKKQANMKLIAAC
jgi:hypothetical protein